MKRIVSISIGSSSRNHCVQTVIFGETYQIERIGTDGDIQKAISLIRELDGKVDAFGMGGIDIYLSGARGKFMIREAVRIKRAAVRTPILDGTGLKNTLEKRVIEYLSSSGIIPLYGRNALVTCAMDRLGMAQALLDCGCNMVIGDLIFALGLPFPIRSMAAFKRIADFFLPFVSLLPYKLLYPVGERQEKIDPTRFSRFYEEADIIAGDFHYIRRYMPSDLSGKTIITNTVTPEDVKLLQRYGLETLVTTTPEFDGRSFGTNVMEALLVAASGKRPEELTERDYEEWIEKLEFFPRIEFLNPKGHNRQKATGE